VHHDQPTGVPRDESFAHHPIHEAAHLGEVADEGESAATPAILAGAALTFVVTLAAIVFRLVITIVHFA
jgi:hypothetical protein